MFAANLTHIIKFKMYIMRVLLNLRRISVNDGVVNSSSNQVAVATVKGTNKKSCFY